VSRPNARICPGRSIRLRACNGRGRKTSGKYRKNRALAPSANTAAKVRSRLIVSPDTSEKELKEMALEDEKVKKFIGESPVKKIIVIKNKLLNIVI